MSDKVENLPANVGPASVAEVPMNVRIEGEYSIGPKELAEASVSDFKELLEQELQLRSKARDEVQAEVVEAHGEFRKLAEGVRAQLVEKQSPEIYTALTKMASSLLGAKQAKQLAGRIRVTVPSSQVETALASAYPAGDDNASFAFSVAVEMAAKEASGLTDASMAKDVTQLSLSMQATASLADFPALVAAYRRFRQVANDAASFDEGVAVIRSQLSQIPSLIRKRQTAIQKMVASQTSLGRQLMSHVEESLVEAKASLETSRPKRHVG